MATATSQSILAVSTMIGVITHLLEIISYLVLQFLLVLVLSLVPKQVRAFAKRLKAKSILALMSVAVFALAVRLILKSGILG